MLVLDKSRILSLGKPSHTLTVKPYQGDFELLMFIKNIFHLLNTLPNILFVFMCLQYKAFGNTFRKGEIVLK